jgi:DNA-binding transcriptional LysR family regulator
VEILPAAAEYGQLRAFLAVGELLSFSRAAEALAVSPSALSQLVRGLEDRVGVRLLNRTTRSVSLTEAGQALFRQVRPAASEIGAAVDQVQRFRENPSGLVRVHSFRSASDRYILPMLADFVRAYPDITLDVTLDDAVVDIVAGGYDVAIRIGEVIERDLVAVRLGPELRQIAVATSRYLAEHGVPDHPRDLVAHRCVQWRWPGHTTPYKWEFAEDGRWFEVAVEGPVVFNDKQAVTTAALAGIGIAFQVEDIVRPHLADGRLVAVLERWSAPFPGHFICYPQQRQMAPAIRAVIDWIRRWAATLA